MPLNTPEFTAADLEHLADFYAQYVGDVERERDLLEWALQEYRLIDAQKTKAVQNRLQALEDPRASAQ